MIDDDAFEALKACQIYAFAALHSAERMAEIAQQKGLTLAERDTAKRLLHIVKKHLKQIDTIVIRENKERS